VIFEKRAPAVLLALAAAALLVYWYEDSGHSTYPPGVVAPREPSQVLLEAGPTWQQGKFRFTVRADFGMTARVLSTERYWFDGPSALSPVDFAVGWGRMSDQAVIDRMGFAQTQRWYRYWPNERTFPIPVEEIVSHSANMHMIPSGAEVKKKTLMDVRRGDLITLSGYLVSVTGDGGWRWDTSLSRTDTGNGACEIV
jgi:hypothetical protein